MTLQQQQAERERESVSQCWESYFGDRITCDDFSQDVFE